MNAALLLYFNICPYCAQRPCNNPSISCKECDAEMDKTRISQSEKDNDTSED